MMQSYGITVPYKVDHVAPSGLAHLANHIFTRAETGTGFQIAVIAR